MKRTSLIPSRGIAALALVLSTVLVDAQTRITPPDNSYSPAQDVEIGQVAGAVLGAIIGGGWGQVISQGTQFGLGAAFLRFSREFEQQADLEGAQIMARAGYDPRDMANMFKTIQKQGGSSGPQWLSDHPNPGNRYDYITREAQLLRVQNPIRDKIGRAHV